MGSRVNAVSCVIMINKRIYIYVYIIIKEEKQSVHFPIRDASSLNKAIHRINRCVVVTSKNNIPECETAQSVRAGYLCIGVQTENESE